VGDYYRAKRKIPAENCLEIDCPVIEEIDRNTYQFGIRDAVAKYLTENHIRNKIHYIVLTKGIPHKVRATPKLPGTHASVDSELALLYADMSGGPHALDGSIPNPYFGADEQFDGSKKFDVRLYEIYLVTRLDAYTVDDVKELIDRAYNAVPAGGFVLDENGKEPDIGNMWMEEGARRLSARGFNVTLESTTKYLDHLRDVMGYCSWGSNDPHHTGRFMYNQWVNGAIVTTYVSSSARTLVAPPQGWKIGIWKDKQSYYAGTPQALIGDLIRDGVTGIAGYAYEPYLSGVAQPQILLPAYTAGYDLAESFYMSLPSLSWQSVVVGDPLCNPYGKKPGKAKTSRPSQKAGAFWLTGLRLRGP
jgi:uncharacterized protein (TIGR03790 family)